MSMHRPIFSPHPPCATTAIEPRHSLVVFGCIVLAHAAVAALFLAAPQPMPQPSIPEPLMVDLIPLAAHAPAPQHISPPNAASRQPTPRSPPVQRKPPPASTSPQIAASTAEALPGESAAPAQTPYSQASASAPTTEASGAVTEPRFDADYLRNPPPTYPMISRRFREEGKVVLRVFVNAEGQPTQVDIKTSSSFQRLDQAALQAVSQWRFVPARRSNTPIGAWVLVPIVFNLNA